MYLQRLWTQSSERSSLWWLWLSVQVRKVCHQSNLQTKSCVRYIDFRKGFREKVITMTTCWNGHLLYLRTLKLCHHGNLWGKFDLIRLSPWPTLGEVLSEKDCECDSFSEFSHHEWRPFRRVTAITSFFKKIVYCNEGGHHDNLFVKAVRMMTYTYFKEFVCWAAETRLASESRFVDVAVGMWWNQLLWPPATCIPQHMHNFCTVKICKCLFGTESMSESHQISNIRFTKSQNLNVSRLGLQLVLFAQYIEARWMKVWLEQHRQVMLQLHLSDQQFKCLLKCVLF